MNNPEIISASHIPAVLNRLASQYKHSITLLGDYEEASTEAIYHYQLALQAVDEALTKIAQGAEDTHVIYSEFLQKHHSLTV